MKHKVGEVAEKTQNKNTQEHELNIRNKRRSDTFQMYQNGCSRSDGLRKLQQQIEPNTKTKKNNNKELQ